jgi:Domain of unknown function (DUF4349)
MSSPDEWFDGLVAELRATAPVASPELRSRVREIAARQPTPARRRPRLAWVLAPAAAVAVAAAVGVGVLSSGGSAPPQPVAADAASSEKSVQPLEALSGTAPRTAPVAPGRRAQLYAARLTLRVRDLSDATQDALRTTRRFGGYIRVIEYGSGTRSGTALLVVRVPIGRVQQAIMTFSELGKILDQHVSVRDAQPTLDRRHARIAELRRTIPSLTGEERARAEAELEALQVAQARDRQRTSFATVSLHLRTKEAGTVVPAEPTRIERALHRAAHVLGAELAALVYALVVAAPFFLLGAATVLGLRVVRRRSDARLMA